jgi:hypothetical protein
MVRVYDCGDLCIEISMTPITTTQKLVTAGGLLGLPGLAIRAARR